MAMNERYMKCSPELPLQEAAKLLLGVGRRNIIIVDNYSRMLGTVSVSDILRFVVTDDLDWRYVHVREVMTTDFISLPEGHSKEQAIKVFFEKKLDYLPVLGKKR